MSDHLRTAFRVTGGVLALWQARLFSSPALAWDELGGAQLNPDAALEMAPAGFQSAYGVRADKYVGICLPRTLKVDASGRYA